jgi:hypothetical protein
MNDSTREISPLRQRMLEDMRLRKLAPQTQRPTYAAFGAWRVIYGVRPIPPRSRIYATSNCTWSIATDAIERSYGVRTPSLHIFACRIGALRILRSG